MEIDHLTGMIIGCAYKVYNTLGSGFLEKVYENAMALELSKQGIWFEQQYPITVFYDEVCIGNFIADLMIENRLIVELKANENTLPVHEVQLVNYLTATGIDNGLLINFSSAKVEVKRKFRVYRKT